MEMIQDTHPTPPVAVHTHKDYCVLFFSFRERTWESGVIRCVKCVIRYVWIPFWIQTRAVQRFSVLIFSTFFLAMLFQYTTCFSIQPLSTRTVFSIFDSHKYIETNLSNFPLFWP
ncbi:uncharacterized protein BO95DRAFT_164866 [Aspergillus brunneoviolaceus CBS 621.78]|uniref:Uncharacterized protein n=2 Tax=Aspergillus TaxID=5052 RepID=A0A8G1RGV9_9EURO|nr:hypothetical protein BO95DRAFT_164866 [Aspergillus brunneoviolaceus CBS 621.78]XP_040797637.1 uncharacterized protein BO72DRAFT_228994 [Aspergillus fijiensis CBS 313.89]RAH44785.1 hypothetical protein BO95DRAFT_164866 [Aspergillus brunneoviolaceus CBS 621.78]RAK73627.1 hypothetical protein BO72DRAFT_228994 [Aspergillus fijiensis CBS 313.89]